MSILKLPVNRPITVTMLFVAIALFGVISFNRLPQELYPSLDYPQITIITKYEGAGPEESEKLISKIIEETVGTAKNLKKVSSISKEGVSIVICEFTWGTDIDFAALEIREKIDLIKERLPKDSNEPIVLKYNPFQLEAMNLSVSYKEQVSDIWKLAELRLMCKKHLKDELERLEGVAKVDLYGGAEKEILVEVDKGRLLANQISLLDIAKILRETNITYPAGTIKEEEHEYTVKTIGEFKNIDDIRELILPIEKRQEYDKYKRYRRKKEPEFKNFVYLSDIAHVRENIKEIKGYSRYNKKDHISVSIYPQSRANLVKTSMLVREKLKEIIRSKFPQDVDIKITYDQADFIKSSLKNIYLNALQGGCLAFLVLLVFLKNIIASIIIALAIPLAILLAISLMYFGGISINTMSLGGLAIGVGMLVDNSIIVLEKIFVEKEKSVNKPKKEVIFDATSHVVGEVISSTLTTIAIFLPLVFVGGVIGQLFKQLALTMTYSLLASILVALFLIPRLSLWLDLDKYVKNLYEGVKDDWIGNLVKRFSPVLDNFLKISVIKSYFFILIYLFFGIFIFVLMQKEFMPKLDERKFILNLTLPSNTILDSTNKFVWRIENYLLNQGEVENVTVNIGSSGEERTSQIEVLGPNQARIIVQLKKFGRSTKDIVSRLSNEIKSFSEKQVEVEFITQQGLFGSGLGSQSGLVVEIKGKNLEKLKQISDELLDYLVKLKDIYGLKKIPQEPTPELKLEVNRDRSSMFGLSVQDVSATILAAIKGYVATKLRQDEDEFDIRVQLQEKDRTDLASVGELTVYSNILNRHFRLDQLSNIILVKSLPEIRRSEGQRMFMIIGNVKKDFDKNVADLKKKINEIKLNNSEIEIDIVGETLALKESLGSSLFALILSIVIIYMILASQFESLAHPFIVMTTIPLGLVGSIYSLYLTFNTINSISMLGFIMLIGIVVNSSTLLVSEYNFLRMKYPEKNLRDIVIEATTERLRPILMTTITTILGLLPLALGIGGNNTNSSMAISILGGLTFSLFLTLFFVPSFYLVLEKNYIE